MIRACNFEINDQIYMATGAITNRYVYSPYAVLFNQKLLSDHNLENPHVLVENDEWTLEKFSEMVEDTYTDLNANDKVDLEKELRLVTGGRMCREVVLFSDSDFKIKDVVSVASVNANICLAGYSSKESKISISQICQKHLNIFGVYNGAGNFASAINLLVTNTVKVDGLIGETISFDNLDKELQKITADELVVKSKIVKID